MSDSWPRRRLLAILRGASEPLDAQELARITGQHVTTVRFHLDVLTKESLVRQFQQPPRGRGRPRIGYRAVQRTLGYQELAQVLADQLGPDPRSRSEAGLAAGRAWGAKLDADERRVETLSDAKDVTIGLLSELGFAPERDTASDDGEHVVIRMTGCPLRDLARTHSDVVCAVHRGLIEEVLDRSGERGAVKVRLNPFVEPELCLTRLEMARRPARNNGAPQGPEGGNQDGRGEPVLTHPSTGRVAPQLRNSGADIAKQSAQQW
ncbi:transcriptional regulator [Nocardia higoensis]|uniref:Transcriptional regulator n=1 Tax=Nocardia higoensis TaxID=228599 RepID=A0ABS0DDW6_9NOCA|nr:transcriptional regulator [Nocardia higoensis]MBF6356315.1 transcriptional regulator [Nocardia higoensis]